MIQTNPKLQSNTIKPTPLDDLTESSTRLRPTHQYKRTVITVRGGGSSLGKNDRDQN